MPGILDRLAMARRPNLPMIHQSETAECGLSAIAMCAVFHGHDVDLASLRRRYSTSAKGVDLSRLMTIATDLGLTPRALRLDMDHLGQLRTPCILHWDMDHFVVLKAVTRKGIVVHDPAAGVRQHSLAEVSKHFTGIALELRPSVGFQPVVERRRLSIPALVGKVRGLGRSLGTIIGLALAIECLTLVVPWFSQWVLDQVLVSADQSLLMLLVTGFSVLILVRVLMTVARAWAVTWVSSSLYAQWSTNVFSRLLNLPLDWFGKRHVGDIVSRFSSIQSVQQTLSTSFVTSLLDGVMVIAVLALMLSYSPTITGVVVAAFGLYAAARWILFPPMRRAQEDQLVYVARQQSEMLESVRAIQAVKLANKGAQRLGRFANATVSATNRAISVSRFKIAFDAANQLQVGLLRIGVIALGALLVMEGTFTVGMLVAFLAYSDQFATRMTALIDKMTELRMLRLHAERIADIALTEEESDLIGTYEISSLSPSIEFRNVSFRYSDGEPWILRNCSFTVDAGQSVAIVGASGCGKSTLAKVMLGLLSPVEGEVLFGGVDIRKIGLRRYREMSGAVMQDDTLLAGSVADNITFFDCEADPVRVELIARAAAIHDDIAGMPMGYNTMVGDMGSALSGGQKQRLILARALYRTPKLLVLDEATSHLDVACERAINHAIRHSGATRILIAHRQETIASAEQVLRVSNGTVMPEVAGEPGARELHPIRVVDTHEPHSQSSLAQGAGAPGISHGTDVPAPRLLQPANAR